MAEGIQLADVSPSWGWPTGPNNPSEHARTPTTSTGANPSFLEQLGTTVNGVLAYGLPRLIDAGVAEKQLRAYNAVPSLSRDQQRAEDQLKQQAQEHRYQLLLLIVAGVALVAFLAD